MDSTPFAVKWDTPPPRRYPAHTHALPPQSVPRSVSPAVHHRPPPPPFGTLGRARTPQYLPNRSVRNIIASGHGAWFALVVWCSEPRVPWPPPHTQTHTTGTAHTHTHTHAHMRTWRQVPPTPAPHKSGKSYLFGTASGALRREAIDPEPTACAPRPPPPGPVCRARVVHRPQATGGGGPNKKTCRQSSAEGPMHRERKKRHGRVARTRRLKVQQRRLAGGWSLGQDHGPTSGVRQAFGRGMAVASSGCCAGGGGGAGGPQSAPHTHVLVCRGSTAQCWISVPTSPSFGLALAHSINTLCLHSIVLGGGGGGSLWVAGHGPDQPCPRCRPFPRQTPMTGPRAQTPEEANEGTGRELQRLVLGGLCEPKCNQHPRQRRWCIYDIEFMAKPQIG